MCYDVRHTIHIEAPKAGISRHDLRTAKVLHQHSRNTQIGNISNLRNETVVLRCVHMRHSSRPHRVYYSSTTPWIDIQAFSLTLFLTITTAPTKYICTTLKQSRNGEASSYRISDKSTKHVWMCQPIFLSNGIMSATSLLILPRLHALRASESPSVNIW